MSEREKSSASGGAAPAPPAAPATSAAFDCRTCGACCHAREGTILVSAEDLLRWRREGRDDILSQLTPGHFSQQAFAMRPDDHACVHLSRGADRSCTIYETRGWACHALQVGDRQCREARRERGLPSLPEPLSPTS